MATKDELKGELDALGVEYPAGATKDELEALLADNQPEEETESEEDNQSEEEVSEEEVEEEVESEEEFSDAGEVTRYGVYKGDNCVAVFSLLNHGEDFKKLAEAKAKAMNLEARPFVDPGKPEVDKNTVRIVNKNGNAVREYSLKIHGKDYKKYAEAFVEKHGEKKGLKIAE